MINTGTVIHSISTCPPIVFFELSSSIIFTHTDPYNHLVKCLLTAPGYFIHIHMRQILKCAEEKRGEERRYPLDSVDWFAPGGCSTSHFHLVMRRDVTQGPAGCKHKQK